MSFLQHFSLFKGKNRIAWLLYGNKIRNAKDVIVNGKLGLRYKLPNLKESIAFSIFVNGIYEEANIRFIVENLPPDSVLLDLGANIGSISMPVARLRPDVRIIGIEASPRVFSYLKHNIELNKISNIEIINLALSDKDNDMVSFYSPEEKFGKGSMSPVFTDKAETIKTITLDTLLEDRKIYNVGFVKIDVEGYENLVFRGGNRLFSGSTPPPVLFEFADWAENQAHGAKAGDAQKFLLSYGYSLFNVDDPQQIKPVDDHYKSGTHMMFAKK